MRPPTPRSCVQLLAGLILILRPPPLAAEDSSKSRSGAILARVLSYELTLEHRAGENIGVVIVYKKGDSASQATADEWHRALSELSSVKIKNRSLFAITAAYDAPALGRLIEERGADVLLASNGLSTEEMLGLSRLAQTNQLLSAGNSVEQVDQYLTLCVTEGDGKPEIVINLKTARLEGISFSSNLLRLARVIR
jgi:hypothetical protein